MHKIAPIAALVWLVAAPARAATLAVVLALDVSASVTADSYILQRDGTARAFEDPQLAAALAATPGGIEAMVLEWSDPDKIRVTVGWTQIADGSSAAAFAAMVHATRRSSRGLTSIGAALAAAVEQFAALPQPAARHVIDISGNGIANLGPPPAAVRDRLAAAGITINALALLGETPWLAGYYRDNVIGGPDAFVLPVRDFHGFAEAMRRKLAAEVAGVGAPISARRSVASGPGARLAKVDALDPSLSRLGRIGIKPQKCGGRLCRAPLDLGRRRRCSNPQQQPDHQAFP